MNHKEKLLEIYSISSTIDDISIEPNVLQWVEIITSNIESQKGVYTVLFTLGIHKILYPNQDIRYHQKGLENGFSGRTIDTEYITPTLKELRLPSMAESGWLSRSLEQPYPYTLDYPGKIRNPQVKDSFLRIIDEYETNPVIIERVLRVLLHHGISIRDRRYTNGSVVLKSESITIDQIISSLEEFFRYDYHISGISKVPVIAFYSMYTIMINEIGRYNSCHLRELGSHTTPDLRTRSSGDIEVYDSERNLLESLEIKYNIDISTHIVNRAIEKITTYKPRRYYILTTSQIDPDDYNEIVSKINDLRSEHGCQLIVNGLVPTLKYYLRLISNLDDFIHRFNELIMDDRELKVDHKERWSQIYVTTFSQ